MNKEKERFYAIHDMNFKYLFFKLYLIVSMLASQVKGGMPVFRQTGNSACIWLFTWIEFLTSLLHSIHPSFKKLDYRLLIICFA